MIQVLVFMILRCNCEIITGAAPARGVVEEKAPGLPQTFLQGFQQLSSAVYHRLAGDAYGKPQEKLLKTPSKSLMENPTHSLTERYSVCIAFISHL